LSSSSSVRRWYARSVEGNEGWGEPDGSGTRGARRSWRCLILAARTDFLVGVMFVRLLKMCSSLVMERGLSLVERMRVVTGAPLPSYMSFACDCCLCSFVNVSWDRVCGGGCEHSRGQRRQDYRPDSGLCLSRSAETCLRFFISMWS